MDRRLATPEIVSPYIYANFVLTMLRHEDGLLGVFRYVCATHDPARMAEFYGKFKEACRLAATLG